MQFMMFINLGTKARDFRSLSADEQQAIGAGYQAVNQTPGVTPGIGLQPPEHATTVTVSSGEVQTTAGPSVALTDAIDGLLTFEAEDLDAAIALAAKIPAATMGGKVEIRPVMDWTQNRG